MQKVNSILLALSVFLFSFYAQAIEVTVGAGQTKIIDSSFPKVLDKLVLEDEAKLVLGADETELRLTVQEMIMGKNVLISAQGKSAKNAVHLTGSESRRTTGAGTGSHGTNGAHGGNGTHGKDITINTGKLSFKSFVLNTSGGNGGNGGNAKGGGKGSNSWCPVQTGGAGGNGGRGGNGGSGGNAGNALITFNEFHILPDENSRLINNPYRWVANGGTAGAPGKGGSGGKGGNGSKCGCWDTGFASGCSHTVSGGNGGNKGSDGNHGGKGASKDVNSIAWFKYN